MKVTSILSFLLFFQPVSSQYNWSALDKELELTKKLLGNDLVVMIWKDDSIVYKKEIGSFSSTTQVPIASCSKWLTATLVMQFVDEGKLSLDDKVAKYIPEFAKNFKENITIRHCLSHMTGIEDNNRPLKRLRERKKFASLKEEVNSYALRNMRANPGTDFWYGNVGLNIAGRVIEVISKKKFETVIETKLFKPLGMTKTTFATAHGMLVNPSGGAKSTADDYIKFLAMLLNKGKYKSVQILSESAVDAMLEPQNRFDQVKYAPASAQGFRYAPGAWVIEESPQKFSFNTKEKAMVIASPGLFGTWPMIDYCRGYAYLVFVKNLLGEKRAEAHLQLKKIIDAQINLNCKYTE